ncbi:MAG TPA: alpha/beta hydrolase-fold protein [Candidatus Acidoferrum sp.]
MKILLTLLAISLSLAARADAQQPALAWHEETTTPRLENLRKQIGDGNSAALKQFWEEMKSHGTPLVETISNDPSKVLVTFLYRAEKPVKTVVLYCQLSETRDLSLNVLRQMPGTDLWFKIYRLSNSMRLSYSFVPDPTEEALGNNPDLQLPDPLNPKTAPSGVNMGHSVLELSATPPQRWIAPQAGIPTGKLEEERIESKILHTQREAWIYTPAGFDAKRTEPYPLLVCFDGLTYGTAEQVPGPTILDNLIAAKKIPPTLMLLIGQSPQPQRNIELSNNQNFLDFVADELLPEVRKKWNATSDPSQTTVCGSSAGGLASTFFAFRRPDVFGNVISQSGAYWPGKERNDPEHEWLTRQYESSPKLPIRFVLQPGVIETGSTPLNGPSILAANRHLRDVLLTKGYEVHYAEVPGGHEALTWRGGLGDALIDLVSKQQADAAKTTPKEREHSAVPAAKGIVAAFEKHPVVIIGEVQHGLQQTGDFLIKLVNDPAFQAKVQDIVIEFASQNNQSLVDRYVAGQDIPIEQVRHIWRDTTKVASWEAPVYAEWLAAIREANKRLPADRRFRVLAGDTAIDWNKIQTHEDWAALGDNNISFANAIMDEVLRKKRRALVVLGGNHVAKVGTRTGAANVTTMIEARYPGSTYVAMHYVASPGPAENTLRLPDISAPALYDLAGTALGENPDANGVAPIRYVDAWLYLGPKDSLVESQPAAGSLEREYGKEIDRRSMVEWGELRGRKLLGAALPN